MKMKTSVLLLAGMSLFAGCGQSHSVVQSASAPTTHYTLPLQKSQLEDPNASLTVLPRSMNDLVNSSDMAVVATTVDVSPARWNAADGKEWLRDPNDPRDEPDPALYRLVTVHINKVLFAGQKLTAKEGDSLVIRVKGDGQESGGKINDNPNDRWGVYDGPFKVGAAELMLLSRVQFPQKEADVDSVILTAGRSCHWTIQGDVAVNPLPHRSVPAAALEDRINAERARGRVSETQEQAAATFANPLG